MADNDDLSAETEVAATIRASMPSDGTAEVYSLAIEIKRFLESIIDSGTKIDSGAGLGVADLHAVVQGVEYHIAIQRTGVE